MPRQLDRSNSVGLARTVLGTAAAVCLLAGCSADGSSESGAQPSSTASDTAAMTPSTTASATPPASPTGTPPPTSTSVRTPTPTRAPASTVKPAFPTAADGSNLKACADATSEVVVRSGSEVPVSRRVAGFSRLVVSAVGSAGVSFGGSTANASVSAGGQQPGMTFRLNDLNVTTVARQGGVAVLRLRPAR